MIFGVPAAIGLMLMIITFPVSFGILSALFCLSMVAYYGLEEKRKKA
jgi:hypothetical protein